MSNTFNIKILCVLLVGLFQTLNLAAQNNSAKEIRIYSNLLKKELTAKIQLPEGYASSKKKYTVLYVLNGTDKSITEMAATAQALHQESGTPEMIVVGVDFEKNTNKAIFFSFMEKELIPTIAKKYRSNQERILFGKAYSGSEVLYAFLTKPNLFSGYISATRQWFEDDQAVYSQLAEKAFKNPARFKGKKIFFAKLKGAYDNTDPAKIQQEMQEFSDLLITKSGKRIKTQYQAFDDWGESVQPDYKACLLFVTTATKQSLPYALPLEQHQLANGKWVIRDRNEKWLYDIFIYDNGPDYPVEGLFRVVKDGKIGFADEKTLALVIPTQFDCAYPFENGKAKVSNQCKTVKIGEYNSWESEQWQYIDRKGNYLKH